MNLQAVLGLMDEPEAVYLATVDGATPRIRAMVNLRRADLYPAASALCRKEGLTVYFTTSLGSGKVRELRANPRASVYYCDPRRFHGVTLTGRVEVLTDPQLKLALWSDSWRVYWPQCATDPDYVVLRMRAETATGWWGTTPFYFEVGAS